MSPLCLPNVTWSSRPSISVFKLIKIIKAWTRLHVHVSNQTYTRTTSTLILVPVFFWIQWLAACRGPSAVGYLWTCSGPRHLARYSPACKCITICAHLAPCVHCLVGMPCSESLSGLQYKICLLNSKFRTASDKHCWGLGMRLVWYGNQTHPPPSPFSPVPVSWISSVHLWLGWTRVPAQTLPQFHALSLPEMICGKSEGRKSTEWKRYGESPNCTWNVNLHFFHEGCLGIWEDNSINPAHRAGRVRERWYLNLTV